MEFTFVVESMIRGYHKYTVWENPVLAEELRCTREIGNPRHGSRGSSDTKTN